MKIISVKSGLLAIVLSSSALSSSCGKLIPDEFFKSFSGASEYRPENKTSEESKRYNSNK